MSAFTPPLSRRATLLGLTSVLSLGGASLAVADAPTERRFVVVILRGAMDGMSAVVPYGDPGLVSLRPALLPPMPGQDKGLLDLGGMYGLHPGMQHAHALYQASELAIVHAVAGPYRGAQPFRGAGQSGKRRRPSAVQRLAEPRRRRAAAQLPPSRPGCAGERDRHRSVRPASPPRAPARRQLGAARFRRTATIAVSDDPGT